MRRCAGFQFDPQFVESFIQMIIDKYDFKLDTLIKFLVSVKKALTLWSKLFSVYFNYSFDP